MIGTGRTPFGGSDKNRRNSPDDDWEVSDELSPDPFAEEEHSRIHGGRYFRRRPRASADANSKKRENSQNQENSGDHSL